MKQATGQSFHSESSLFGIEVEGVDDVGVCSEGLERDEFAEEGHWKIGPPFLECAFLYDDSTASCGGLVVLFDNVYGAERTRPELRWVVLAAVVFVKFSLLWHASVSIGACSVNGQVLGVVVVG